MYYALAASLVIHLLLLWSYGRMADWYRKQQLRPTRYLPDLVLLVPELFRQEPITGLPSRQMERVAAAETAPVPLPGLDDIPVQPLPTLEPAPRLGEDSVLVVVAAPPVVFLSQPEIKPFDLNRAQIEAVAKVREEYERYVRHWRVDIDTTDAESMSQARARAVVVAAFEAMGGMDRLLAITEMRAVVWIEAQEHFIPPRRYVSLPAYAYPIALWRYWGLSKVQRDVYRVALDLSPDAEIPEYATRNPARTRRAYYSGFDGRWVISAPSATRKLRQQSEAARWHMVDRFLGEGIRLRYLEAGRFDYEPVHRIEVDDRKYGRVYDAFFHRETGLLVGTQEALSESERRWYKERYRRQPPIWTTAYDRYEEIDGVLTARRWLRRWKHSRIILHLNIRYNGAEPDTTLPEL